MSQYFVLLYSPEMLAFYPLVNTEGQLEEFASVVEAEEAAVNPNPSNPSLSYHVYDLAKHEVLVPIPGTPTVINGQWVKAK